MTGYLLRFLFGALSVGVLSWPDFALAEPQPIRNSVSLQVSKDGLSHVGKNIEQIINFYGFGLRLTDDLGLINDPENKKLTVNDGTLTITLDEKNLIEELPSEYETYSELFEKLTSVIRGVKTALEESLGEGFSEEIILNEPHVGVSVQNIWHELDFAEGNGFTLSIDNELTKSVKQELGISNGVAIRIHAIIPYLEINIERLEFYDLNNDFKRPAFVNSSVTLDPHRHKPLELEAYFFIHSPEPGVFELIPQTNNVIVNDISKLDMDVRYEELYLPEDTLRVLGKDLTPFVEEALDQSLNGKDGRLLVIAQNYLDQFANDFIPNQLKEITEIHIPANLSEKNYFQPPGAKGTIVEPLSYLFEVIQIDLLDDNLHLDLGAMFSDDSNGPFANNIDSQFDDLPTPNPQLFQKFNNELKLALHQNFLNQLFVLSYNRGYLNDLSYKSPEQATWFQSVEQRVSCENYFFTEENRIEAIQTYEQFINDAYVSRAPEEYSIQEALTRAGFSTLDEFVSFQYNENCVTMFEVFDSLTVYSDSMAEKDPSLDLKEIILTTPPQVEISEKDNVEDLACHHPDFLNCQKVPVRLGIGVEAGGNFLDDFLAWMSTKKDYVTVNLKGYMLLLVDDNNALHMVLDSFDVEDFKNNIEANNKNENFRRLFRGIAMGKTEGIIRDFNKDHAYVESELSTWNPLFLNAEKPFEIVNPILGLGIKWKNISVDKSGYILVGGDFVTRGQL